MKTMKTSQVIHCVNMGQFIEVITALTKEGLTFEAYAAELVVYLTGGY